MRGTSTTGGRPVRIRRFDKISRSDLTVEEVVLEESVVEDLVMGSGVGRDYGNVN